MLIVVDQNLQGEEVRQVKENTECPGLMAGDRIVSEYAYNEIKEYLNRNQNERNQPD